MSLFVQLHQPLNLSPLLQGLFNNYFVIAFEGVFPVVVTAVPQR